MCAQIRQFTAKGSQASRLRQRKYALIRKYNIPENLLKGPVYKTHRRCNKTNCHCSENQGHPQWCLAFSRNGKRYHERIPEIWVEQITNVIKASEEYLEAIQEVILINLQLLAETRAQTSKKVRHKEKNQQKGHKKAKKRSTK